MADFELFTRLSCRLLCPVRSIFAYLLLIISACTCLAGDALSEESGLLRGKVSIGPLCPVEPCKLTPEQLAKIYEQRKVVIYELPEKTKAAKVELEQNGEYSVSLKPGRYLVDVTDGRGNELPLDKGRPRIGNVSRPKVIELRAGGRAEANFHIDTGIR